MIFEKLYKYARRRVKETAICLFIVAAAAVIYLQMLDFGLVAHDDMVNYKYFLTSTERQGFLHTLVTPPEYFPYWVPVTYLSYMIDFLLWGGDSGRHHLNSLFYHIINGLLLFFLMKKISAKIWPSAFIAVLLIIHPLNVEAVALWASRSILVSTLFALLTLLAYIDYAKSPGLWKYLLVILWFTLGLMSQPTLAHLPCILLILDCWPLNRLPRQTVFDKNHFITSPSLFLKNKTVLIFLKLLKEKIPFILIVGIFLVGNMYYTHTYYVQSDFFHAQVHPNLPPTLRGLVDSPESTTLAPRQLFGASVSYLGYLWKTIWPTHLSWYIPTTTGLSFTWREIIGAFSFLLIITGFVIKARKQAPYLPAGWLWFLTAISPPVINNTLLQNHIRDHYAYFPVIGLFMIAAWGGGALLSKHKQKTLLLLFASSLVIVTLATLSWRQASHWENQSTIYKHALTIEPESPFLHNNLGKLLYENGEVTAAVYHFEQAIQALPDAPGLLTNLGAAYYANGQTHQAKACFQKAFDINPAEIAVGRKLALLHCASGDFEKAALVFKTLLAQNPEFAAAICYDLACVYALGNQPEISVKWLQQSISYGFNMIDLIEKDINLNNIRHTEYYNYLIKTAPADKP